MGRLSEAKPTAPTVTKRPQPQAPKPPHLDVLSGIVVLDLTASPLHALNAEQLPLLGSSGLRSGMGQQGAAGEWVRQLTLLQLGKGKGAGACMGISCRLVMLACTWALPHGPHDASPRCTSAQTRPSPSAMRSSYRRDVRVPAVVQAGVALALGALARVDGDQLLHHSVTGIVKIAHQELMRVASSAEAQRAFLYSDPRTLCLHIGVWPPTLLNCAEEHRDWLYACFDATALAAQARWLFGLCGRAVCMGVVQDVRLTIAFALGDDLTRVPSAAQWHRAMTTHSSQYTRCIGVAAEP